MKTKGGVVVSQRWLRVGGKAKLLEKHGTLPKGATVTVVKMGRDTVSVTLDVKGYNGVPKSKLKPLAVTHNVTAEDWKVHFKPLVNQGEKFKISESCLQPASEIGALAPMIAKLKLKIIVSLVKATEIITKDSSRLRYANQKMLLVKIRKMCFGTTPENKFSEMSYNTLDAMIKSFSDLETKLENECQDSGIRMDNLVTGIINQIKHIGEFASNLDCEGDETAAATKPQTVKGPTATNFFLHGQIDPCDDKPAFLNLSEVCKAARFLDPTLKPLDQDLFFLTRPGEKLIWAANQMATHKRSKHNAKKINMLQASVKELKKKQNF